MNCLTAINTNQSVHDDILDVNIDSMAEPDSSYENNINNELFTICPRTQLAQWAIKNNISNVAVSDLLKIVNSCYDISIAIDARTLLKTDNSGTNIPLRDVLPGLREKKSLRIAVVNKHQEDYHVGSSLSILINISKINIINVFSLDYMYIYHFTTALMAW
ncbi:Uncharacterized protein FWK35_00036442 [Aphis craccivora]|uniref:Uncharacterized protein n=1 Tax=Aphis craccivora TaxID=307492 RepID=A0A6G0VXT6_APHCR|nr:Uncharacterized protein FWK35_00036442 [Aphis craccivora]